MKHYAASLSDLRPELQKSLPLELIMHWNVSNQTLEDHEHLLAPYKVKGTLLSSDSAGLSKLAQKYSLAQVMKLVSEPKEVIYSLGHALGGTAIGVWAADNTQFFFEESIPVQDIAACMLQVHSEKSDLALKVGIGLHHTECYLINNALYGKEAHLIEELTENESEGGELLLSKTAYEQLGDEQKNNATIRSDLSHHGVFYSIVDRSAAPAKANESARNYPMPFNQAFYDILKAHTLEELEHLSLSSYTKEATCVFLWTAHRQHELLLQQFTDLAKVQHIVATASEDYEGDVVKSNGALAIVLFENPNQAIAFSKAVTSSLNEQEFSTNAGICSGEVMLFPLEQGGREIAGNPVNVASKLAEDSGLCGIMIDQSVVDALPELEQTGTTYHAEVSKVMLTGIQVA